MPRLEHLMIPAPDGVRLAATLYLPDGEGPWPALLEALPYRKDDQTLSYRPGYLRFADAGYVMCRVDVRGTGSSEGIATDEYPATERTDLAAVIDWLATQAWSTGAVGMFGTSYSGFNSLQLAMERPPALKAIVSIFASDDRYADDVHYYGGALKALDTIDYPTYMVASNALPPVPARFGDGWREEWARRVEGTEPWVLTWLAHQTYDDYWAYGSAREGLDRIEAATMLVGGWADGYTNICLRSFPELRCPKRVLIGPWPHAGVETCVPGPTIDLDAEMLRWWDRWLKGVDTGVDDEPPIAVYQQRSTRPDPLRLTVDGTWRYEPTWPPERLRPRRLRLDEATPGGLAWGPGPRDEMRIRGDVGPAAWISCAAAMPWCQPADQGADGAASLSYTWEPLAEDLDILGHPRLRCRVTADVGVAYLSAKVVDVSPAGDAELVVRGMVNLAHRSSRSTPEPMVPGEPADVELELEAIGHTFAAGHRIRLDLATADWPNAWSPPLAGTLTLDRAATTLELPVLDGPPPVDRVPQLPPSPREQIDPRADAPDGWARWSVTDDIPRGERRARVEYGDASDPEGEAPGMRSSHEGSLGVSLDDPGHAWSDASADLSLRFPEAEVRAVVTTRTETDAHAYRLQIDLVVSEDGAERWHRTWERTFPRDHQ